MVEKFIVGKRYRCKQSTRPVYFNDLGDMDAALTGEPLLCTESTGDAHFHLVGRMEGIGALFEGMPRCGRSGHANGVWYWLPEDFEEEPDPPPEPVYIRHDLEL